jgi:hypothetical protein
VGKRTVSTCNECYFRQAGLCALQVEAICPTFRQCAKGSLVPPVQPRLIPRPLGSLAAAGAAA